MRIDTLHVKNFKKYEDEKLSLHPQFTLLVGPNASGKTALLDAVAVSMGIWLVEPPDTSLQNSRRNILPDEIRLQAAMEGDRLQFRERRPVAVTATGRIGTRSDVSWTRQIKLGQTKTTNSAAREALETIRDIYSRDAGGESIVCPVLAYYGAGRAWLPSNARTARETRPPKTALRWGAFYDCFEERIRFGDLRAWFHAETTAAGNRGGRMRPGFEVVRLAVLRCVPGAEDLRFDADRSEIVFTVGGAAQPFSNLSAGQQMMLALVADIAIKAVTQNAHLLPPDELGPDDQPWPRLLNETPGIVLIDELDVHLHPSWQRRVAADLKRTFPAIQFVCTTHSPQVIGEVSRDEVRVLGPERISTPGVAKGADSNWLLDHEMGASSVADEARRLRESAETALDKDDLPIARARLEALRAFVDGETGELARLGASLEALERLDRADSQE